MTFCEAVMELYLFVDFGTEITYGSDAIACPLGTERFATVSIPIFDSRLLCELIDGKRKERGFKPMYPPDWFEEEYGGYDKDGWYEFYVEINDLPGSKRCQEIEAIVCNSCSSDDGDSYYIDLSEEEAGAVFHRLDEQCQAHLGKGCASLLSEARQRMLEDAT